jgi:hypothetical protein
MMVRMGVFSLADRNTKIDDHEGYRVMPLRDLRAVLLQ